MPVGSDIPLVIQAGRWRRQLVIPNVASCQNTALLATLAVMPSTHLQGDIPLIAIVTGAVDATECALRKIGIADSEFTDPGGTGRINFYLGDTTPNGTAGPGAQIDASTPSETVLEGTQAAMNQYDLVMYSCQGAETAQTPEQQQVLINYANAGGRVYATHYAYVWLDNDPPFEGTADWDVNQTSYSTGTGTINQAFPEGLELAQWLQAIGATTTLGQIPINTLREDFNGVVAPSELWLTASQTVPSGGSNVPMQYTFNTPVGASAANQCGRVQFNDYHVENSDYSAGETFPAECPGGAMTPQEKLLEYNLFDLTNFLAPDLPPVITLGFVNGPTNFKQGDGSDTITINVSNTSTQTAASNTLTSTVTLPAGLTALTMTDASGNWVCNAGTLVCVESSPLNPGASDSIVVTVSVASGAVSGSVGATVSGGGLATAVVGSDAVTVVAANYCAVDANCSSGQWCDETTNTCTPELANGTAIPSDPSHTNPTLNGTCTPAAGALVCGSGVCDTDNKCGYNVGDGPCTPADGGALCRSGTCSVTGVCETAGSCDADADCSAGHVCSSNTCVSGCDIGGTIYASGAVNPASSCQVCIPSISTTSYSNATNGTSCNDGNACTQTDTCQSGVCTGSNPVTCTAADQCHAVGTCNPSTGACSNPALPNGTTCNDGNACTQTDTCQSGTCTGTNPVTCSPEDACHIAGSCNPSNGICSNPTSPDGTSCGSGLVCESGVCQATQFVLTIAANPPAGGTVTPTSGSLYNQGVSVPITATANTGYTFVSWSSSPDSVAKPDFATSGITMNASETVTAQFSANLVVNTANDDAGDASNCTAQATPGINTTDSACGLRDALLFAADAGAANITFDGTAFSASNTPAQNTITLGSAGTLTIPPNTTITGATSGSDATLTNLVTVDGAKTYEVFNIPSGTVAISSLTIADGKSSASGGGIRNLGTLTVTNSTITGNQASGGGGGIVNAGGTLTVASSTFSGNQALNGPGGGINNGGALTVTSSTFSGNQTTSEGGGGIVNAGGTLTVANSTFSGNQAPSGPGGGILSNSTLSLANTIVSGNTANSNPDITGSYTDKGGNVVGSSSISLAPLGNYGGPTLTMIPLPGSTAICAASSSLIPSPNDQRGLGLDPNCPKGSVDAGSVQSNYALSFTTSPSSPQTVGQTLTPTPVVTLSESSTAFTGASVNLTMTAATGTLSGTTTEGTSTTAGPKAGQASFTGLSISPAETGDSLTAGVTLTAAGVTPAIALTAQSQSFDLTAGAASLTIFSGSGQRAVVNTAFASPLAVIVKDASNNPVSGVTVSFSAPGTGASAALSAPTAVSDSSGLASVTATANTVSGAYSVTASTTGVTSVSFSLTNAAATAASMAANAGTTPQSAGVNTAFANALAVTVKDAYQNPVHGVSVTFTAPGSGGSGTFSTSGTSISVTTNSAGVASAPFTANGTSGGPYTVTASAAGLTTVNFNLTNTAGGATHFSVTAPPSATAGASFQITVTALDASNNTVAGYAGTVRFTSSDGSAVLPANATLSSGVGVFTATLKTAGTQSVSATDTITASITGSANVNVSPAAASKLTINAGSGQSTTVGTAFAVPLLVKVTDAFNNPVQSVTVSYLAPLTGASAALSSPTAVTGVLGVASVTATANTTDGAYSVTASATGATSVSFSLSNTAAAAATMAANAGTTPQSAAINTAFANALAVTVKDASNNPVSGVSVAFTAPGSGASGKFSNSGTSISVSTNTAGVASAPFTANATPGGPYTVTAATAGLPTVSFSLTNTYTQAPGSVTISVPSTAYLGGQFNFTVTVYDQFNAIDTGYMGTMSFTSTDSAAALPANYTFTSGDAGQHIFQATLNTLGSQKITATDAANSLTIQSSGITVSTPNLVVTLKNDGVVTAHACTVQTTPGTGTDSSCNLRNALAVAAVLGSGSISFDSTVFATPQTVNAADGTFNIPANTTITGPTIGSGASLTNLVTINGLGEVTVFTELPGVTSAAINNLIIANGSAVGGGGIDNDGGLTVSSSTISGNTATDAAGGIENGNDGVLTVIDSTISGNTSNGGDGIQNLGSLKVINSTISGNSGGANGGGIASNGTLTVIDSTISGNSSSLDGGGIYAYGGTVSLANTIVSGNTATNGPDTYTNGATYNNNGGNLVGGAANLSALGYYGGPTQTMLPLPTSDAVCAGLASNATSANLSTDQRGFGFNSTYCAATAVDSGAVQSNYALSFITSPNNTVAGQTLAPSPVVKLTESSAPVIGGAVSVSLSPSSGTLNGTTAASTSTTPGATAGEATFSGLNITPAESSEELTATVALTNSINLTANSSSFNVTPGAVPTLTLSASPSTSVSVGTSVTFKATLNNAGPTPAPTGTVTFTINGSSNSDCPAVQVSSAGIATCTTASLLAPADAIAATYSGDPNYTVASPAMLTENVSKATASTGLTPSPLSPYVNQLVTFSATVLPPGGSTAEVQPTGNVTFKQGSTTLCGPTAINPNNQIAACSYAFTSPVSGATIAATYSGDQNFAAGTPGTAQISVATTATTTSITSTPNPSNVNQPVIFKATVTPAYTAGSAVPAGTVVFTNTSTSTPTQLCSVTLSNGVVPICKTAFTAQGSDNVTATYTSGDTNFSSSASSTDEQGVGPGATSVTLTSSPLPSTVNQPVTITAVVGYFGSGATKPTGNIIFTDTLTSTVLCAPDVSVKTSGSLVSATCTTTFTSAATHPISAAYSGDANFNASTSVLLNQVVNAGAETITWPTPKAITYGTKLSATQLDAKANVAGAFVYSPAAGVVLGAGSQTLSVTFTPNDTTDFSVQTVYVTLQVNKATPTLDWDPASITLGSELGAVQLDATSKVAGLFTYTPPSGTVVTTLSEKLNVLFTPDDITDYNTASKAVSLKVIAGPLLKVSPLSINFGEVKAKSVTVKNVTLTNLGTVPVTIDDPFLSIVEAGSSSEFVAVNLCPKSLEGQKSCQIRVAFVAPAAIYTPQKATLNVQDDAPGSPQKVTLTAQVIKP